MAGGARRSKKPCAYALDANWPYAVMDEYGPARIGQAIARALAEAMERQGLSANALASAADVNRQVITYVLRGETWPDILTVANLELALGEMLWPRHFEWPVDENGVAREPKPPQGRLGGA